MLSDRLTSASQSLVAWWNDLSFRTARDAVGAVRYQPRRVVLAGGRQLEGLKVPHASPTMGRLSHRLDLSADAVAEATGRRLGGTAEAWVRWFTGAAGGLIDNVGASAIDDLPLPGAVSPRMLKPHVHTVGVLVVDMRGFSKLTMALGDPQELTDRIEEYLADMTRVVEKHGGVVFQYTGDGLLALFLPELTRLDGRVLVEYLVGPLSSDLHRSFRHLHERWRTEWSEAGRVVPEIGLAVGLTYGAGTIGMVGPPGRKYFGIVGSPVNQAAYFCSQAHAGTTLIDEATLTETGAARPEASRRIRLKSEKLHQRIATIEIRPA